MADRPHFGLAGAHDIANDDPFAELTRIMGFDPRQPNRPAPAPRVPLDAPVIDAFDDADFAIDLEKELMGEFADAAPRSAEAAPRSVTPSFAPVPAAVHAPVAAAPIAAAPIAAAPIAASPQDDFFDESADKRSSHAPVALEDDWFSEQDFQFEADPEDAGDHEITDEVPGMDAVEQASQHARSLFSAPLEVDEPESLLDDEFADEWAAARAAGIDLEDEHDAPVAVQATNESDHGTVAGELPPAPEYVASEPLAVADDTEIADDIEIKDDIEIELDEAFDSALAEMPFDLSSLDVVDDEPRAVADDHDLLAAEDADLVAGLALDLPEEIEEAAPEAQAYHAEPLPVAAGLPERRADISLEDELNALLGNSLANYTPPPVAAHIAAPAPVAEPAAVADEAWTEADDPLDTRYAFDVDDEPVAEEVISVDHADPWRDAAEPSAEADASWHEAEATADLEAAPEGEDDDLDLEFDEQAFDAAFSNAIKDDGQLAEAPDHAAAAAEADEVEQSVARDGHDPYAALEALSATLRPTQSWSRGTPVAPRESAASRVIPELDRDFAPVAAFPAMSRHFDQQEAEFDAEPAFEPAPQFEPVAEVEVPGAARSYLADVPEIETVDVPEHAVALADDLDLPEFAYEDESAPPPTYDDIDAEFTSLLNEMNAPDAARASPADRYDDYDAGHDRRFAEVPAAAPLRDVAPAAAPSAAVAMTAAALVGATVKPPFAAVINLDERRAAPASDARKAPVAAPPADEFADMEFAYDPDLDEEMTLPMYAEASRPRRRGLLIAALVGGVAVLGGVGAYALSYGNGVGSEEPALVKADVSPIKVKPENPGGTTVPNQDNKVYDSVAGAKPAPEPVQEKLVTTAEEPIEIPAVVPVPEAAPQDEASDLDESGLAEATQELAPVAVAPSAEDLEALAPAAEQPVAEQPVAAQPVPEALPGVALPAAPTAQIPAPKGEDRIEQIVEDNGVDNTVEVAAVAPRKVRTMIVKADGTLVAREDTAPQPSAEQPAASANASVVDPAVSAAPQATGAIGADAGFTPPEAAEDAVSEPLGPVAAGLEAEAAVTPEPAPAAAAAPAEPAPAPKAEQPVQVAATDPVEASAPAAAAPAAAVPVAAPRAAAPQAQSSETPAQVAVAPTRPSDQPVNIVGEVKAEKVAALSTAAPAAGAWAMQIASQPNEAAAQSSYQDLLKRYSAILEGRPANIVKADIAGKGTFWRVRVPAGTRNDAISLCESYKAAGGNCFVSK